MNKQQKLKLIFPVLILVMFFVWKPVFMGNGRKKDDVVRPEKAGSQVMAEKPGAAIRTAGPKKRTSYEDWGRNPFSLIQRKAAASLFLEGVLWDERNPQAMINGDIYGVGATIDGMEVIAITPNSVMIKGESGERELRMGESF